MMKQRKEYLTAEEYLKLSHGVPIPKIASGEVLTHKAPPIICSRRQFQIWLIFQK